MWDGADFETEIMATKMIRPVARGRKIVSVDTTYDPITLIVANDTPSNFEEPNAAQRN